MTKVIDHEDVEVHARVSEMPVNIVDCLASFTADFTLDEENLPRCSTCKDWHPGQWHYL